jgi:hypothetical protein
MSPAQECGGSDQYASTVGGIFITNYGQLPGTFKGTVAFWELQG